MGQHGIDDFHRAIIDGVAVLPAAARQQFRRLVFNCCRARSREEKIGAERALEGFVSKSVFGHGMQAAMSAASIAMLGEAFTRHPNLFLAAGASTALSYGLINAAVIHTHLVRSHAVRDAMWRRSELPARSTESVPALNAKALVIDTGATLLFQAAAAVPVLYPLVEVSGLIYSRSSILSNAMERTPTFLDFPGTSAISDHLRELGQWLSLAQQLTQHVGPKLQEVATLMGPTLGI